MIDIETILIQDVLNPATLPGAIFYAGLFLILATITSTIVRRSVHIGFSSMIVGRLLIELQS